MDCQHIISEIGESLKQKPLEGQVASYIPELSCIDPKKFGVYLQTTQGKIYRYGDSNECFSIQSIAKVFLLVLAYQLEGEALWERVDVEPSGTSFNSLMQLEYEKGIPRNPMINAGALVLCDVLFTHLADPKTEMLHFIRKLGNNQDINYSNKIARSEQSKGYRNYALANYLKSLGNLNHNIDAVTDFYFHTCSIEMTCQELAQSFMFLANKGIQPQSGELLIKEEETRRINAIMQTCGFYDEAGEFAFRVGLPGKSGVGGGIVALKPNEYVISVWSPPLNSLGNSQRGMEFLEAFTSQAESSIF